MPRVIDVYLRIDDVKQMIVCKQALDAVIGALGASTWQGARGVAAALGPVDLFICDLFNRAEPHWLEYLNKGKAAPVESVVNAPHPPVGQESDSAGAIPEREG
jgi:hypothetical protein